MQKHQNQTNRYIGAEEEINAFLEKGAFDSLSELKVDMRDTFLGGGPLSSMTTPETVQLLRLRVEPESGGEFTILVQDDEAAGIKIHFRGLPTNRSDYANQLWAYYQKSGPCPEMPLSETVQFGGLLAHELRRKLKVLALMGLRKPVPTQFDAHIKKYFFASLEIKTARGENSISFSSHEAHLDPLCDHLDIVKWFVGSSQKILGTTIAKERLESFHHVHLMSNFPAA